MRIPKAGAEDWPAWLPALEASARANARSVTYYFAGPPANLSCANCVSVPTTLDGLLGRVEAHLGVARATVASKKQVKHLVCDLKPMWPALFPELASRHEFVGYADLDVIFGDLAAEVDALGPGDDLLAPSAWYPAPLANGNFLLFRRERADLFRAFDGWRDAVTATGYFVYDEWHGPRPERSFMHALLESHLAGRLRPRPTRQLLLQDVAGAGNLWDPPARVELAWSGGALVAAYDGPCVCVRDRTGVSQFSIAQCAQCAKAKETTVLRDVAVSRKLEVLAYHMLSAKNHVVRPVDPKVATCDAWTLDNAAGKFRHAFTCRPTR